jgi:hypothetical protein
MRQCTKKLLALLTALALAVSMTGAALAAPQTEYIDIRKPANKSTFYIGEKIPYTILCYRPGGMSGCVYLWLKNNKTGKKVWKDEDQNSFQDDSTDVMPYEGKIATKKLAAGTYTLAGNVDVGTTYDWELEAEGGEQPPYHRVDETATIKITLKKLKAPTKLKASAGKRKVTLSWKKASGAKKYEIYRSTKKKSGYKKIATTTKTKYENKKLKKGARYYYKVRTLRGSAKSGFTKPVLSGKVK